MSESAHEAHGDLERLKKRLLTVKHLTDKLNVSEKMIYSYVSQNRLPYVKIESNVRFTRFKLTYYPISPVRRQPALPG